MSTFYPTNLNSNLYRFDFITPSSDFQELLIEFHHDLMFLLLFILGTVCYLLLITIRLFSNTSMQFNDTHSQYSRKYLTRGFFAFNFFKHKGLLLEIIWTVVPALTLFMIALPSFALLYSTGMYTDPEFSFKAIGHQ